MAEIQKYGELIPVAGGDPIPLLKEQLTIGRHGSCDIVLRFATISSKHCQLTLKDGYWFVDDTDSLNGTRVNDVRIQTHFLAPGDILYVAKYRYEIQYSPAELGAVGPPPAEEGIGEIFGSSLLDSAGLERRKPKPVSEDTVRFDTEEDLQEYRPPKSNSDDEYLEF